MEILPAQDGVDPNKPDSDGKTPLQRAARNGHEELVKILLRHGVVNHGKLGEHSETLA